MWNIDSCHYLPHPDSLPECLCCPQKTCWGNKVQQGWLKMPNKNFFFGRDIIHEWIKRGLAYIFLYRVLVSIFFNFIHFSYKRKENFKTDAKWSCEWTKVISGPFKSLFYRFCQKNWWSLLIFDWIFLFNSLSIKQCPTLNIFNNFEAYFIQIKY